VEYESSKQVAAGDEIKQQILKTGIRKLERVTSVSHHTITNILRGKHVRRKTLVKVMKHLQSPNATLLHGERVIQ